MRRATTPERAALEGLRARLGDFLVQMDDQSDKPARLFLAGVAVPNSVTGSGVAAAHAQSLLPELLRALRPETQAVDYRLSVDHLDSDSGIRTLAFEQRADGRSVEAAGVPATLSLRYKHDRLVAIANESLLVRLPNQRVPSLSSNKIETLVRSREGGALELAVARDAHWWLARRDGKELARLVYAVELRRTDRVEAARLLVDAHSGEVVERRSKVFYGSSPLRYDVPERWPEGGRILAPVSDATIDLANGGSVVTDVDGVVTYDGNSSLFTHDLGGPHATVDNVAGSTEVTTGQLLDGETLDIGFPDDEQRDAQLTSFIHTNLVKDRLRSIAPEFGWADFNLPVNVNIDDNCNAFWDGGSINFFVEGSGCANTGRLADVVYHEYGHGVHQNAIIPGVGAMATSLSEGISDYLAATIVDDSGMGRGFFAGSGEPLRQLDPVDFEWTWPEDIGEVHDEGRIIGGAYWDLRKSLIEKYGYNEGVAQTDRLWFQAIRRSVDIPSAYFETIVADDDDGNLENGTPNVCEINAAFGTHGLFQVPGTADSLGIEENGDQMLVGMQLEFPFPQCDTSAELVVSWQDRDAPGEGGTTTMSSVGGDEWLAEIPRPPDGTVLQWAVDVNWNVGTEEHHPSNLVDPWYETYVGPVIELYCTSFEDDLAGWWASTADWEQDEVGGGPASGDPQAALDGDLFMGTRLSGEGTYSPGTNTSLTSPVIDTEGYSTIRLQYWRDLDVEDGFFDQARIRVNEQPAWSNFASSDDFAATRHHRDAAWRFQDVDLSEFVNDDGSVQVSFELQSDGGLHFGGWNIDKMCVVAIDEAICGNGVVEGDEACDDGNNVDGDGCSADCTVEDDGTTGDDDDGGLDESEAGTGFGDDDGDPGFAEPRGCNCEVGSEGTSYGWLALFGLLGLRRRRRE